MRVTLAFANTVLIFIGNANAAVDCKTIVDVKLRQQCIDQQRQPAKGAASAPATVKQLQVPAPIKSGSAVAPVVQQRAAPTPLPTTTVGLPARSSNQPSSTAPTAIKPPAQALPQSQAINTAPLAKQQGHSPRPVVKPAPLVLLPPPNAKNAPSSTPDPLAESKNSAPLPASTSQAASTLLNSA
jgi:hypothetical protein